MDEQQKRPKKLLEVRMKNKLFILMVIIVFLLLATKIEAFVDKEIIDAKIKLAADLFDPQTPEKDPKKGFKLLVEAIVMALPDTQFPAEFKEKTVEAKKLFDSTSIFNQEAITLLNESYLLANSGKEFQFPASISSMPDAVEYAKRQIDVARKNLERGEINECVKILMEIALMVVTPRMKT